MLQMHAETHVCLHVKCPLFLSDFNQNWSVLTNFSITSQSDFMEIHSVVLKLLHADRQTDMVELMDPFLQLFIGNVLNTSFLLLTFITAVHFWLHGTEYSLSCAQIRYAHQNTCDEHPVTNVTSFPLACTLR
jgi:hypothetical protein